MNHKYIRRQYFWKIKKYKLTGKENVFFTALVVYLEFSVNFMLTRF